MKIWPTRVQTWFVNTMSQLTLSVPGGDYRCHCLIVITWKFDELTFQCKADVDYFFEALEQILNLWKISQYLCGNADLNWSSQFEILMPDMGKCSPEGATFYMSTTWTVVRVTCKLGYLENNAISVLIFWPENLNSALFYAFPHHRGALQFSLSKWEKIEIRVFLNFNFSHMHRTCSFYFTK